MKEYPVDRIVKYHFFGSTERKRTLVVFTIQGSEQSYQTILQEVKGKWEIGAVHHRDEIACSICGTKGSKRLSKCVLLSKNEKIKEKMAVEIANHSTMRIRMVYRLPKSWKETEES